jgi:uncharacterized Zn finger protein
VAELLPSAPSPAPPCPHCGREGLKGIDFGNDLRTIVVRCSECGRMSVITVND